jgi:hypothetical protein
MHINIKLYNYYIFLFTLTLTFTFTQDIDIDFCLRLCGAATLVGWCDGQFRVASPLSAGDVLLEVVAISDEYHHEHLKELVLGQLLPFVDVDNVVFLHMVRTSSRTHDTLVH